MSTDPRSPTERQAQASASEAVDAGERSGVEIAAQLEAWAVEAGFTRAGIAGLEPSRHSEHYRRWIEAGHHAGMGWMAQRLEERGDPARLLPGARSALVVALQYHPLEGQEDATGDLWPRVARYAHGRDYHDIMGRRLKALAARIRQAYPECQTRPYVDTGPILERELAARAGIGSVGKHTNLLHPHWGSWFLIGEILLSLELPVAEPLADMCGRCRRCLDACPTGALPAPFVLDSRRCISYWTIEHRGDLPHDMRPQMGEWVYGCDICQEVCPWNDRPRRGEPRPGDEALLKRPSPRRELDLAGLLALDREGYVAHFQVSPMKRPKLEGLQRNAAVAMGNRGDRKYLPALAAALDNPSAVVRRHAAWALSRLGGDDAARALREALAGEEDVEVHQELERSLDDLRSRESTL